MWIHRSLSEHFSKIMPELVSTALQHMTREMIWLSEPPDQITAKMKGQEIYCQLIKALPFVPVACAIQCCLTGFRSSHYPYTDLSLLLFLLNPSF